MHGDGVLMGLIQAPYAPVVPFRRPDEDPDGDATYTDLGNFSIVLDLSGPGIESGSGRQDAQQGTVFVQRGSELLIGDQFPWGGTTYMLIGGPDGDMDHPFTGNDFGWVSYTVLGQMARWGRGR